MVDAVAGIRYQAECAGWRAPIARSLGYQKARGGECFGFAKYPTRERKITVKRILKPSAADLALAALRQEIVSGQWGDRMPGTRVLANRLGVSPPSVAHALTALAAEGLLIRRGERCAYRVVGMHRTSVILKSPVKPKRLLILTHDEMGRLVDTSRGILERLRALMAERGWEVAHQVIDFVHVKHPQRSWDRKILIEPGTSVIALYGRPALAEWAIRRKVRMFFLGGVDNGLPVSMAGVKSSLMAEAALTRLTALGHWRIVLPLCDRPELFKEGMREVMQRAIESAGRVYTKSFHNPESNELTPDAIWRMMEVAFSAKPPTALVFLDWKELVTAQSYLLRIGRRVPEDVSVVLLNDQMEAEWFQPKLCRFKLPTRRLLGIMVDWLEDPSAKPNHHQLSAEFMKGRTMAAPGS
jgi:DNA-binding Lrp family transcriptional regulator